MKRFLLLISALVLSAIFVMVRSGLGKRGLSTLHTAGEVAHDQLNIMILSVVIMSSVVFVVFVVLLLILIKFRRKDDDKIPEQIEGNKRLEILWTLIPTVLIIVLAVPTIYFTYKFAQTPKPNSDALVIEVRGNQYWWEFAYPNGVITSQELVIPAGEKVYFKLQASDVKHSFWIPSAGGKMDTNVDGVNEFWLEFDSAGEVLYGKCAELCGHGHALMDFKVVVKSKDEYEAWLNRMSKIEVSVNESIGKEVFDSKCASCHATTPMDKRVPSARIAPNLGNFGNRQYIAGYLENNSENLRLWLTDSASIKPGNKMAGKYGDLSEDELNALIEYVQTLTVK